MSAPIVEIRGLTVSFGDEPPVLHDIDLTVRRGETVAVVGPSGSGKTTVVRAILGMLDASARVGGSVVVDGVDLTGCTERERRDLRGSVVGYVSQDPFGAMDPIMDVGTNIAQAWRIKKRPVPDGRIVADLAAVDIADASARVRERPFTWSGGMLQRGSVVTARALEPKLVLADEPTSALDEANAHRVMATLTDGAAALLIVSHDRALVEQYADRVYVADHGTLVEAAPSVRVVSEQVPPRNTARPDTEPILRARGLTKKYPTGGGLHPTDLDVHRGEIVGLAGPSGAGKSTLLRVLAGIEPASGGTLTWDGLDGPPRPGQVGIVFQNAVGSLDPHWPIYRSLTEPLAPRLRSRLAKTEALSVTRTALDRVGLGDLDPTRRPRQLSGGQAQRVAIARALVGDVWLLLADEPTASLDDATSERILDILRGLADDGLPVVMVSHADRMLRRVADTVVRIEPTEERSSVE
ncbi:ABC transporter ATP-binding protein [Rhodococcus triatomae]|uniref:Peptide/nickel transport system ATP-binding protein n=1 Tax=Rhodococcus triatomae TaxID=300028 RepID=A0A1G8M6U9_9NOCA|nr:ATP-binding cassette domain-containing protein [Rhodococcus triatomae]QNG18180.1 ABC transporter ATP-binding protein [Rhodococcus triatomae]QNG22150.1 ABC transporter ATP-binding protein [Rhodococcus triatomae]SDI63557.1 peptide/nickel transport system ATP-binding protein [Rhodococcus triatomae]